MAKKVVVPIAQGFEEIEAVTVIDILRRAGIEVTVAGVSPSPITGRTGIRLVPDVSIDQVKAADYDMVVLPGGSEGTTRLAKCASTQRLLKEAAGQEKYLAAICAAPTVLSGLGLIDGKRVTSHPSVESKMSRVVYWDNRVVVDGKIITSRAPGTAMEFAMALVEILAGKAKVEEVNRGVLAKL
jgi:4-methyl-5(b-hydroxyethyl)-thiazole monophosphate biosynthesis